MIETFPHYKSPLIVEFPLKGTYAIAGNSRKNAITHAGLDRFCFDFTGITRDGFTLKNKKSGIGENEDYVGFGNPIYSSVDGVVEFVKNEFPDLKPSLHYTLVDGNYVTIKDKNGFHHIFAHLKHGSAKVVIGQKVKAGEVIGQLGNSGMTTLPHLHYGVYSKNWVVSLPVKFRSYKMVVRDFTKRGFKQINETVNNGVPLNNSIAECE